MTAETPPPPPDAGGLRISRRHLIIGGVLAGASLFAQAARPTVQNPRIAKKVFLTWFPKQFGSWRIARGDGIVLPPQDVLSDRLYDNLVSTAYVNDQGMSVMMVIAYNYRQDGVVQIHRPEVCYPAGGYTLSPTETIAVTAAPGHRIPASVFAADGVQRSEQVLYWTRVGDDFPLKWSDQRLSVIRSNLQGAIPDGVLARFSIADVDKPEALAALRRFIPEFVAASKPPLRKILFGST